MTVRMAVFATGVALLVAALLTVPARRAPATYEVIFEQESAYHSIRIVERGPTRHLVFNRSFQGGMYRSDPFRTPYLYADYLHLAWVLKPDIRRVLVIGLGAGTIPKRIAHDYAEVTVDVVELDPAVASVARRFFDLRDGGALRVIVKDGRVFLQRAATYDLIIMDAYVAEGIPFHLATTEFFELARRHLTPGGVVAANIVGALEGPGSTLFRSLYKTYARVFPILYVFPVGFGARGDPARVRTIVLLATLSPTMTRAQFVAGARQLQARGRVQFREFAKYATDYYDRLIVTDDVPIFTDDYAPTDVLPVSGWEP